MYQMLISMQSYAECGERNWWADVADLLATYRINSTINEIKNMSKGLFKKMVKEAVRTEAVKILTTECSSKKKTSNLHHECLQMQEYMQKFNKDRVRLLFQCRAKTVDIKDHRHYKYDDRVCRGCSAVEETLEHIVNCGFSPEDEYDPTLLDVDAGVDSWEDVLNCVKRVELFINRHK